jgi:hypothetical protein
MTVLSTIVRHCQLHALAIPTAVVGSTDTQVIQLLAILQETLEDMQQESDFQVTTLECVFTAVAGQDQGPITALGGGLSGYRKANFETFFDRSLMRPLYGPVNDTEWQDLQALPNPGPFYKFRIWQNKLWLNPAPTAPFSEIAFEYMSEWAVLDNTGAAKPLITADDDSYVFPENIVRKWLIYRWKLLKGLPYQEDRQKAYDMLNNYIATDKVKRRVNVSCTHPVDMQPGIFVPLTTNVRN